ENNANGGPDDDATPTDAPRSAAGRGLDGKPRTLVQHLHRSLGCVKKQLREIASGPARAVKRRPDTVRQYGPHRAENAAPALFRKQRVGQNGRAFTLVKFRSMRVDADQRLHADYMAECIRAGLPLLKLQADPRITRIGKILRATSLDELPQLVNVLRGEM